MSDSGTDEKKVTDVAVQPDPVEPHAGNATVLRRLLLKTDLLVMPGLCKTTKAIDQRAVLLTMT